MLLTKAVSRIASIASSTAHKGWFSWICSSPSLHKQQQVTHRSELPQWSPLCTHLHAPKGHRLLPDGGRTERLMIHTGALQRLNGQKVKRGRWKDGNPAGNRRKQTRNLKLRLLCCFHLGNKAAHKVQTTASTRVWYWISGATPSGCRLISRPLRHSSIWQSRKTQTVGRISFDFPLVILVQIFTQSKWISTLQREFRHDCQPFWRDRKRRLRKHTGKQISRGTVARALCLNPGGCRFFLWLYFPLRIFDRGSGRLAQPNTCASRRLHGN